MKPPHNELNTQDALQPFWELATNSSLFRFITVNIFQVIGRAHHLTTGRAAPPVSEEVSREGNWKQKKIAFIAA
jgi:hypothetical protein